MRRTACSLVQVAARTSGSAEAAAAPALVRSFASPPPAGEHHETPLSKFMPAVAKLPRQVVTTALSLASGAVTSAATSGTVKGWVTSFADKVVVSENVVALSDVDVPFWASWLSWAGYAQHGGFKKFAAAVTPKVAALSPAEVTDLTVAFHRAGYYDKDLFDAISANIQKSFVTYDTEQLLSVLGAFAQFGHYSEALYDDIADSITYANHYLAPLKQPAGAIATALSVYAKYDHERADLFTTLSRGLSELSIGKLSAAEQREVALKALRAFNHFQFWPENADALFYVARQQAAGFTADEAKEIAKYQTLAEDQAGGEIKFYDGSEDAGHWYGHHTHHAPQSYSLYVFRDSLVPKEYSPLSVRPWKQ